MATEITYDRYRTLLAEKKRLFTDYNVTTLFLKQSAEENNDDQLRTCLEKRHRIINDIEGIDRSLRNETEILKESPSMFGRPEIISTLKDINILMNNSSIIETECLELVAAERNSVKNEIMDDRMKHRRNIGYQNLVSDSAKYIDTKIR